MNHLTTAQRTWQPLLGHSEQTLAEVYHSMPRDSAEDVPWIVRALENPASPLALPGAVELVAHDCIHALLGRGLLPQDEAFVLGFTMGTARGLKRWHMNMLRLCAERLYRGAYRFSHLDGEVFAFGVACGHLSGAEPLAEVDFHACFGARVCDVRRALGLDSATLAGFYEIERSRWPETLATARLPRDRVGDSRSAR